MKITKSFLTACIWASLALLLGSGQALAADASLVLYFGFDEGSGNAVADMSGNGNNGTINGGAAWVDGVFNSSAVELDGSSAFVQIEANASLNLTAETTYAVWLKYNAAGTVGDVDSILSHSGHFWSWVMKDPPNVVFESGNGPWGPDVISATALTPGEWTHVAMVRTSDVHVKVYINGELDIEGDTYAPTGGDAVTMFVGSWAGTTHFLNAGIDELKIWNRSLTDEEVKNAMDSTLAVKPAGKLASKWSEIKGI